MKRITLSADADLIKKACQVAKSEHTTLNAAFRQWPYARRNGDVGAHRSFIERLKHIDAGGPYTRDEMNER
jgi:hypothetical protein